MIIFLLIAVLCAVVVNTFVLILVFLQLKNVQATVNRQFMSSLFDDFSQGRRPPFGVNM